VIAADDIGTNSTRLLLGDDRRAVVTGLGRGVDRTGRLDDEAVARTVRVLDEFGEAIRAAGATEVRAVATSAARDAENVEAFLDRAERALGARPQVLSGDAEARLAFAGATSWLDPAQGPFLVVDIGGGSTELAVGTTGPEHVRSMDTGAVRLTEQWLAGDPPTPEELSMAVSVVRTHLEEAGRELPAMAHVATNVGVAGTVTTVAAVELGGYDRDAVHGFRLSRAAAEDVFRTLATETLDDRRHNPGLQPERADVIVGGCCILVGLLRHLDAAEILVSECDLLDGLVLG
jgi:exopolyphosphatase/guanosine-5'-triphosphate,3'-diphosphate pyrophosphatase